MKPYLSKMDLDRFGVTTAKATVADGDSIGELLSSCDDLGAELSIIRIPIAYHVQIAQLEASGAFLADTLVYTRNEEINRPARVLPRGFQIRLAKSDDAESVSRIAGDAFAGYDGHYHSDPRLSRSDADMVYVSWAGNCCSNPKVADAVHIAEYEGEIIAFGALKNIDAVSFDGVLFGVHPDHRRKGLLSALIARSMAWGVEHDFLAMEYSTHLTNTPALRAVTQLGFHIDRSMHTFHRWVEQA